MISCSHSILRFPSFDNSGRCYPRMATQIVLHLERFRITKRMPTDKEFLAIFWSVNYLCQWKFEILTDH